LRGQFCAAPGAATPRACEQPAVDATRFQPGRLRPLEHDPEKTCPNLIRGGHRFLEKIMLKRHVKTVNQPEDHFALAETATGW
jgi:hypothetical protein